MTRTIARQQCCAELSRRATVLLFKQNKRAQPRQSGATDLPVGQGPSYCNIESIFRDALRIAEHVTEHSARERHLSI